MKKTVSLAMILTITIGWSAIGQITGWRQNWTSRFPDATGPLSWGPTQSVAWATAMPNWGNASPVMVGERIFVCAEPDLLLCVNKADGNIMWQRNVGLAELWSDEDRAVAAEKQALRVTLNKEYNRLDDEINETYDKRSKDPQNEEIREKYRTLRAEQRKVLTQIAELTRWVPAKTDPTNGYTSATPVSDGKHVWVLMGTGVAACFDMDGNRLWIKFIDNPIHHEGQATSPVLSAGKLLLNINKLAAYDPLTGEKLWENNDCTRVWGTAYPFTLGDMPMIITAQGNVIRSSDGVTVLNKIGNLAYSSPLVRDNVVYFIETQSSAIRLEADQNGSISTNKLWETQLQKQRYYTSPLLLDGVLYTMHQKNLFYAIDAATGEIIKSEQLDLGKGDAYTSVAQAGARLYIANESGMMAVIQAGRDFKVLGIHKLDKFRTTPIFEKNRMYLRTYKYLYCFAEP